MKKFLRMGVPFGNFYCLDFFSYFWVAYTSMSEFIHISSADINNAGKILRLVSVFKKKSPYPSFDYKGNSSI